MDIDAAREEAIRQRLAGRAGVRRSRIPRVDRGGPFPLSFGQERMWLLQQLEPESPAYLVPLMLWVEGDLDVDALDRAAGRVIARHEILRTRYELSGARGVQVIDEPTGPALAVTDLTEVPPRDREARALDLATRDARTPIDLAREHPVRLRLYRLAADRHLFTVVLHHIACDDGSMGIFWSELAESYRAATTGGEPDLPELEIQYADYAAWQRTQLDGDRLDRRLDFWRERLSGLSPVELPVDRPRPAMRDWAGDRVPFDVPAPLIARLRGLARRHDVTLFVVLVTAFQALLSRYTGQRDIAVGTAFDGRSRRETQQMIGFLLNTVVMRARWTGDPPFSDLLAQNRSAALDAIEHQDAPIQRLTELEQRRDLSRSALFQVMFDVLEAPEHDLGLPGLRVEPVEVTGMISKYDLTVQLGERPDGGMFGVVEYATALFDRATAERVAEHYLRFLDGIAERPGTPVSDVEILGDAEYRRLVAGPVDERPAPSVRSVSDAVAAHAATQPDAIAVVAPDAKLSYADLDAAANRVAHHLRALGVGPESVVGVCLDRGADLLPALIGVWRTGAAYVPVDPAHPADRVTFVLADSGARVVITGSGHADLLSSYAGTCVFTDRDRDAIEAEPAHGPGVPVDDDGLAYVIYTSGSTGRPKGVQITHGSLRNYLAWAAASYGGDGRRGAPLFSSVAFDLVVTSLYVPLLTGGPVHILEPTLTAGELGGALAAAGPFDLIKLTPAHLELLEHQLTTEQAARLAGCLVVGGDAFPRRLLRRWRELAGDATTLVNEYGPTEITVANVAYTVRDWPEDAPTACLPIGRAIPGTTAYVLDDALRPAPTGVVGEVYLGGIQVARGYGGRPAMTAARYGPNPYGAPGSRLYRTGDLGRVLASGDIEFIGRADDQIKIAGYRIEPGEVSGLLAGHPDVREAVVMARPDRTGSPRLVAYVVPSTPEALSGSATEQLRALLTATLPAYMIPTAIVPIDDIPLTSNGKVDAAALPEVDRGDMRADAAPTELTTELHERVASAWREVLGLSTVGAEDNFFDFGGDSLRAVALVGVLRDIELDVSVQDIFEFPTIDRLCQLLASRPTAAPAHVAVRPFELLSAADAALVPPGVQDAYPLSMVQAGMVYEMLADTSANNYHNTTTFYIRDGGPFSLDAMREAAAIVVSRHEMLRTSIDLSTYSEPLQLVHDTAELGVGYEDLRGLDPGERERRIREFMAVERATVFDLTRPSLLRAHVFDCADDCWAATISECHAVLEGWSYNLLLMEVLDTYRIIRDGGRPVEIEAPAVRFADFIKAERDALRNDADRAYWRSVVTGHSPLTLPAAWAAGGDEDPTPYKLEVRFDDLADRLVGLAEAAQVPLKSVLHAAHLKVMSMIADDESFYGGLVCDARPEVLGAERVLGMYLNTVPFAFRLTAPTWRSLVRDVFARETELWPHRRYPVPAMQREMPGAGRLNEVMFNYLDFRMVDLDRVDAHTTIDDSPNEFGLSTTVFRLGVVDLTIHPRLVGRAHGTRLAAMYRLVLDAMAANWDGDALRTRLTGADRRCLEGVNATGRDFPAGLLPDLFEAHVLSTPDAVAVLPPDGTSVTYRELDARANQLAWHLRGLGVGPDTFVGVLVDHSVDFVVAVLGVLKAGGAYVPLDPETPGERVAAALDDTAAALVLTHVRLRGGIPAGDARAICLDLVGPVLDEYPTDPPARTLHPLNLAYVIFTSGSTGRPKGVMVTHGGIANYLRWAAECYRPMAGAPLLGSVAFDLCLTNLFVPLVCGREINLLPGQRMIEDLARLLRGPGHFGLLKLTPTHLDALRAVQAGRDVDTVDAYVVGGEDLRWATVAAWRDIVGGARILNEYGPTETVVGCSAHELGDQPAAGGSVPIGRPVANMRMYVLDGRLNPAPVGVRGELYIGGPGVARGYVGQPVRTAERFVPDPYGPPGSRLYRTGDLARCAPDGTFEFLGRVDDQVKVRGYRVELGEIEAALVGHPDVAEAVAVVREDRPGDRRLVAYVVGRAGAWPETGKLVEFLRPKLPAYMIPAIFVPLDSLPVGAGGKVDRRALPAPAGGRPADLRHYVAPGTDAESTLAGIWARVLDLDRVGVHDDFFELGGDSILSLHAVSGARQAGLAVTPRMMLTERTVARIARVAATVEATDTSVEAGPVALTPIQRWFLARDVGHADYSQSVHLAVEPPPDAGILERALHAVVQHHDALRLRLTPDGTQQLIAPEEAARLVRTVDLRHRPDAEHASIMEKAAAAAGAALDPAAGPVINALLFRRGGSRPDDLLLTAHRLAVDGVSWQIIVPQLATAYEQLASTTAVELPARTSSFSRWASRLDAYARSEHALAEIPYWLRRPACAPIPQDRPAGENTEASAATVATVLDGDLTTALLHRRAGADAREVLLAALTLSVAEWSGGDGIVVELEGHGREDLFDDHDLSRSVGWFTTLFPVALALPPVRDQAHRGPAPRDGARGPAAGPDPRDVLAEVVRQLGALPRHGIGFGILRYLADEDVAGRLAALPAAEITFNYLGRRMDYVAQAAAPGSSPRFAPVLDQTSPARSDTGLRANLIDINASEYAGRLEVAWTYSRNIHQESTIKHQLDSWVKAIRRIVNGPAEPTSTASHQ